MIFAVKEKFGKTIRLTEERWAHITNRHPETKNYLVKIKSAIQDPEIIVGNPFNKTERYYHKCFNKLKNYLVVIIEIEKGFVITAFISRKVKKGEIIWKKL